MAYTRFVLERGLAGDLLDLQVALAPCLVGYGESGERLLADPATRRDGNPYGEWIAAYTSEGYRGAVRDAVALLDRLGESLGAATRYPRGSSPPSSRRRDWRRRSGTWAGGPGRCRVILETRTHPHPEADVALANGD